MARGINTYLDLRVITLYLVVRSGDDRQSSLLQRLPFSTLHHFDWDIFLVNTMTYARQTVSVFFKQYS